MILFPFLLSLWGYFQPNGGKFWCQTLCSPTCDVSQNANSVFCVLVSDMSVLSFYFYFLLFAQLRALCSFSHTPCWTSCSTELCSLVKYSTLFVQILIHMSPTYSWTIAWYCSLEFNALINTNNGWYFETWYICFTCCCTLNGWQEDRGNKSGFE